ncbi:MAG: hypothetical protein JWP03_4515 [Phycisphaerales bacterium]|nr:hypothetical protein [Phycisphaerales bacterium]
MKRHWVEYGDTWMPGPMSFWVHVEADGRPWNQAAVFDPPRPGPIGGRGYARFYVEVEGFTFYFASLQELEVCIQTLARRVLPSTLSATVARGVARHGPGPNKHWLSRLPSRLLPMRRRLRVVEYLRKSLADFECDSVDTR